MNKFFSLFSRGNTVTQTCKGNGNVQVSGSCVISNSDRVKVVQKRGKTKIKVDGFMIEVENGHISVDGRLVK